MILKILVSFCPKLRGQSDRTFNWTKLECKWEVTIIEKQFENPFNWTKLECKWRRVK